MSKIKYNPLTGEMDYIGEGGDLSVEYLQENYISKKVMESLVKKPDIVFIPSWNDREYIDHIGTDIAIVRLEPNRILAINEPIISTIREVAISLPNDQFTGFFELIFKIPNIKPPIFDFPPTILWDTLPVFEGNKFYRIKVDRYANADGFINIGSFTALQFT